MAKILGISCYYHDAAATLMVDGKVVACAEEERFSRDKHDRRFPQLAIDFCLKQGGIQTQDLDFVAFYENPLLKLDRIIVNSITSFPEARDLFAGGMRGYLGDRFWIGKHIRRRLGVEKNKVLFCEHHLSHACSSFFVSPFNEAAVITVDGIGEWNTMTVSVGRDNSIEKLYEINFPHSLGLLYSAMTSFLGFEVNEGEYKVMGLAPYGKPTEMEKIRKLVTLLPEGRFAINLEYFTWHKSSTRLFSSKLIELLGPARERSDDALNPRYANIAASLQKLTEEVMVHIAKHAQEKTGLDSLCLAGGVALNSVANHRIRMETKFRNLFIQPAAGDSGGALGAALYCEHMVLKNKRKHPKFNAYLGQDLNDNDIKEFLDSKRILYKEFRTPSDAGREAAKLLAQNKVIGWVQGRFEWGPRALGARSILANPTHPEMRDIVNEKVKFRELFRPFAPAVLEEHLSEYFDTGRADAAPGYHDYSTLYYMLEVLPVLAHRRELLPSVTHVDGSGRVQAVSKSLSPEFWELIEAFRQLTSVPVLLNTSFNRKGEPMVNSPNDAWETFRNTGLDHLVIGRYLISK